MTTPRPSDMPHPTRAWGYTQMKAVKISYTWTIENFRYRQEETGESLCSPSFSTGGSDKLDWQLEVYPRGDAEESEEYISLFLTFLSHTKANAWYKFCIINAKGKEIQIKESDHSFAHEDCYGYNKFIKWDFLLNNANVLLPNDKLTILCELTVLGDTVNLSGRSTCKPTKVPNCQLLDDLGDLLDTQRFTDVTISIGDTQFPAHKAILAARSPVFAAMFEHDMKESNQNCVKITDVDSEVMKELLKYIYTGKADCTSISDSTLKGLLIAADKYALERLKVMCEDALCSTLTIENVCDVLVLADMHGADQLKRYTIDFVESHASVVLNTSGWNDLLTANLQLATDVIRAFSAAQPSHPTALPTVKRLKLA